MPNYFLINGGFHGKKEYLMTLFKKKRTLISKLDTLNSSCCILEIRQYTTLILGAIDDLVLRKSEHLFLSSRCT